MDILVRGGTVFDGRGGEGVPRDLVVRDGKIAEIREPGAPPGPGEELVDATGKWVMPGFIDLHTHYDAEVEILPGLTESVRHGVTTIAMGSCSLSLAFGDATNLADMFCRVEAIPRSVVLPLLKERKTWNSPGAYFEHLESLPLGPNVCSFLGHSTMRMEAMGMERSLSKSVRPDGAELATMDRRLDEALEAGFLGMSIMTLPWDKMDGEEFRSRPLPSVFARWSEYRRFNRALRAKGRVFQGVPNISTKLNVLLFLWESVGLWRKTLKTTAISFMDIRADRAVPYLLPPLLAFFNRALRANFRLQALPEVFDLWADGIDLVVFEEFGAGGAALHLQDDASRAKLLADPEYRQRFRKQWRNKLLPKAFHRQLELCEILSCPGDPALAGKTFGQIAGERAQHPVDTFLDLVATHGRSLRWYTVMGNDRPEVLDGILRNPHILIGFSDAGAHLRNMAHYNFPLRLLRLAKERSTMPVGKAVWRLTGEIAEWLGLDAGILEVGRRADVVVVDPAGLNADLEVAHEEEMTGFGGLKRLVRRDRAVPAVLVNGRVAFRNGAFEPQFGKEKGFGAVLRAK